MGSLVHKFLKRTCPFRIISSFSNHQLSKPTPFITPTQLITSLDKTDHSTVPLPVSDSAASCNSSKRSESIPIFPNSPFGFYLNPIYPIGFDRLVIEEVEQVQSDARKIWADSVKKKRKRKMNKHKYKKLRKRLRRKT